MTHPIHSPPAQLIHTQSESRANLRAAREQLLARQERIVELEQACRGLHEDSTVSLLCGGALLGHHSLPTLT